MTLKEIALYHKIKDSGQDADKYREQANLYESVLTGTVTEFTVPDGWTKIRSNAFSSCSKLASITIPSSVTSIGGGVFDGCTSLTEITIPNGVTSIGGYAFRSCTSLTEITMPNGVTIIGDYAFSGCKNLTEITIPDNVTSIGGYAFSACTNLTNVTLGNGFNCNGLNISASTKYSVDTLVAMLTALADRTGETAYTITLGATNLEKLSDEQKAIATDKNWTLA